MNGRITLQTKKKLSRRDALELAVEYKNKSEELQAEVYGYQVTLANLYEWMSGTFTKEQLDELKLFLTQKAEAHVDPSKEEPVPKIWTPDTSIIIPK